MKKLEQMQVIGRFLKIHGDLYDYGEFVFTNISTKGTIICRNHGEFQQTPKNHFKGHGCPKCAGNILKTTEIFINEAQVIFGDLYDYSQTVYINNIEKVKIVCKIHGIFEQPPVEHLSEKGCRKCADDLMRKSLDKFIIEANNIHNDKYDYSEFIYINSATKGTIICFNHGKFFQSPNSHLREDGCPKCGIESKKVSLEEFKNRSNKAHNNYYSYDGVILNGVLDVIEIICPKHGLFSQIASKHMNGSDCPSCIGNVSKAETKWLDGLNVPAEYRQKHIIINDKKIIADAYDPENNTIYEFNGDYWHGNPDVFNHNDMNKITNCTFGELHQRTIEREKLIKSAGYNLITIWENDFKNSLKLTQ